MIKALCPKCGSSVTVTAANTLRQHGTCKSISVDDAAGTVEIKSKPRAVAKKAPTKKAPAKKTVAKAKSRAK